MLVVEMNIELKLKMMYQLIDQINERYLQEGQLVDYLTKK
jgi:hypothetical protein